MFNLIKSLKKNNNNNNNDEIVERMNQKINILDKKIEQKDKIINEMKIKLVNQEKIIKEVNEKLFILKKDYYNAKEEIKKADIHQNNIITNNNDNENLDSTKDDYPQETDNEIDNNMKELINQKSGEQLTLNQAKNIYKTGMRIPFFHHIQKI